MARFFVYLEENAYNSIKSDLTTETRTGQMAAKWTKIKDPLVEEAWRTIFDTSPACLALNQGQNAHGGDG
jgi:hypothetical protein